MSADTKFELKIKLEPFHTQVTQYWQQAIYHHRAIWYQQVCTGYLEHRPPTSSWIYMCRRGGLGSTAQLPSNIASRAAEAQN